MRSRDEAETDLVAVRSLADKLRQPQQLFWVGAAEAMLAVARGRLAEGEKLMERAFAHGERAQPEMAIPIYAFQRYTLCDFRGELQEVEHPTVRLVNEYPARPVFRCLSANLQARLGRLPEAEKALAELAEDRFAALPFDQEWLLGMSLLAETASLVGDAESGAALYAMLAPWAALNVADFPEGIRGSVSRYLGILATMLKRWRDAERHFEDALEMNGRMNVRPWLAHTRHDYARMLRARRAAGDEARAEQLLEQAVATYRELGMPTYAAEASAVARP